MYVNDTNIYICLKSKTDIFNKIKLTAVLEDYLLSVVNLGKNRIVIINAAKRKSLSINRLTIIIFFQKHS